jgi:RNA polymerase sigma-70 factor, ECF subfamily
VEASRGILPGQTQSLPKLTAIPLKRSAERAFEQLYRKHAREVYQYALAVLTNPADAEDVTQQTFLNAFRAFQRGERPRRPHNWLIAIAHNVCRMRWRQANHRPKEVALEEAPEPAANPTDDQPNLDEVLQALARLSFNQRAALVMRELEGRSYKEIANVLDVSVGAVEALLFRARRHLRLQKRALGVLGTAPLPTSLASSLGLGGAATGGGAGLAGGATIGGDLVLKAAALVAVGAMTAGVGYRAIEATRTPQQPAAARASEAAPVAPAHKARLTSPTRAKVHRAVTRKAHQTPTRQAVPALAPPSHNVQQVSGGSIPPQPALPTTTPVVTTPPLPVQPPAPPALPTLPQLPVQPPPLPVTPPKLPLPPIK